MQKMFVNLHFEKKCQFGRKSWGKLTDLSSLHHFLFDFHNQLWFLALMHTATKISKNLSPKSEEMYSQEHRQQIMHGWKLVHLDIFTRPVSIARYICV